MNLTPEQEATIKKNLSDQYWRMNHLYWIQDANGNKVRFKMNAVQDDFYWKQWYLNVIAKARQFGFSTLIDILILDTLLFNRNTTGGVIDRTDEDGQKKLGKMRFAYEHLTDEDPDDPEGAAYGQIVKSAVGVVRWNEHEARFTNDSQAWTATSLRGGTTQILHISEYGPIAYDNPIKAQEIKTGPYLPPLCVDSINIFDPLCTVLNAPVLISCALIGLSYAIGPYSEMCSICVVPPRKLVAVHACESFVNLASCSFHRTTPTADLTICPYAAPSGSSGSSSARCS